MKIGFVVNDVETELPQYTTTRLAMAAAICSFTASGPVPPSTPRRSTELSGESASNTSSPNAACAAAKLARGSACSSCPASSASS